MATNLFDFNAFGTPGNSVADRFVSGLQNTPATPQFQPTGGGMMPPTPSMKPLPPNPIIAKPKAVVAQPAAK